MKTPKDEAFDELAKRQGDWGGGYQAKRKMAADKLHWSDCAVHNGPAYPKGECDCGATEPWNEDEWRKNNWRCHHGWLRGEQCEICNAPQPAQERERVVFPTMLRKMWSGSEVQAWLDENVNKEKNNG